MASPTMRQWQNPEHVLVIQTAFLGDIVLATGFLKRLRLLLPNAKISFVTTPVGAEILSPNPWQLELIPFDKRGRDRGPKGLIRKIRELRKAKPDLVFSLHRSMRSAMLVRGIGAKFSIGFQEASASRFFDERVSRAGALFEAQKNDLLLQRFCELTGRALPSGEPFPELLIDNDTSAQVEQMLGLAEPFVILAPSSVWATKRWPAERFGELALEILRQHGFRSVVIGGRDSADIDCANKLLSAFEAKAKKGELAKLPIDLTGQTNLSLLKSVIGKAKIVVANDSAPMHISIAMGIPVIGVFGPTTKELGFFPFAPEGSSLVVENESLTCRPCGKHGHQACPLGHFRCMLEIDYQSVFGAVTKLLRRT